MLVGDGGLVLAVEPHKLNQIERPIARPLARDDGVDPRLGQKPQEGQCAGVEEKRLAELEELRKLLPNLAGGLFGDVERVGVEGGADQIADLQHPGDGDLREGLLREREVRGEGRKANTHVGHREQRVEAQGRDVLNRLCLLPEVQKGRLWTPGRRKREELRRRGRRGCWGLIGRVGFGCRCDHRGMEGRRGPAENQQHSAAVAASAASDGVPAEGAADHWRACGVPLRHGGRGESWRGAFGRHGRVTGAFPDASGSDGGKTPACRGCLRQAPGKGGVRCDASGRHTQRDCRRSEHGGTLVPRRSALAAPTAALDRKTAAIPRVLPPARESPHRRPARRARGWRARVRDVVVGPAEARRWAARVRVC